LLKQASTVIGGLGHDRLATKEITERREMLRMPIGDQVLKTVAPRWR